MKFRFLTVVTIVLVTVLGSTALAADANPKNEDFDWWNACVVVFFFLAIGFFIWGFFRSGAMTQGRYLARAGEHMDKIEKGIDRLLDRAQRVIELLEQIEWRFSDKGTSPKETGENI